MLKWVVYVNCCCYFNRPFSLFFCNALWCVTVGINTKIFMVWPEPPECIWYIAIYFVLPSECNVRPADKPPIYLNKMFTTSVYNTKSYLPTELNTADAKRGMITLHLKLTIHQPIPALITQSLQKMCNNWVELLSCCLNIHPSCIYNMFAQSLHLYYVSAHQRLKYWYKGLPHTILCALLHLWNSICMVWSWAQGHTNLKISFL